MPTVITQPELDIILQNTVSAYAGFDKFTNDILKLLYATGLRINEVLEVNRWSSVNTTDFNVSLEKGDSVRVISGTLVPSLLQSYYVAGVESNLYTYSALLWRINKATPVITVNGDVRRSSSHLFRYNFIKKLYADGMTTAQIKAIMCHKSQSSTNMYIFDQLYLH